MQQPEETTPRIPERIGEGTKNHPRDQKTEEVRKKLTTSKRKRGDDVQAKIELNLSQ